MSADGGSAPPTAPEAVLTEGDFREFVESVLEESFHYRRKDVAAGVVQKTMTGFVNKKKAMGELSMCLDESVRVRNEAEDASRGQEEDFAVRLVQKYARRMIRSFRERKGREHGQHEEVDVQEQEYAAWLLQKYARRMLWRFKQQRGELGPEHTDAVDMALVRHSATVIQAHYRSFAVRRELEAGPSQGVQAQHDGDDYSDEEEEEESPSPDHDGAGKRQAAQELEDEHQKQEPFSVESMWVEREIDIKDTRSEDQKVNGLVLQAKYWPLGAPRFPAPRFARAYLQEGSHLEGREAFLRRSVIQQIEKQRAQFGVIHRKLLQLLAVESEDRQRVVRREGRFRQVLQEEAELHWGAIVRLDLALRWGDKWADTYADLVGQVVETETKLRKNLGKEELAVRANLAVREFKSRRQVLNLKSSFSSLRQRPNPQTSSAVAIRDGSGRRHTSSIQDAKSYSQNNTGFSKEFDSSLVHLRSRRAIQRLENQQINASRAEDVRRENQLFEQTLTDNRHWALSNNFAKAIKQRDETKARRKEWKLNRAQHLEDLRYEAKVDEFASRRVAYEIRYNGREDNASPEKHQRLLLPSAQQTQVGARAQSRQGGSSIQRLRTAVHKERRSQTSMETYPTQDPDLRHTQSPYGTRAPPTAGTNVQRASNGESPSRNKHSNSPGPGKSNALLPLESKLVALVERAYARYNMVGPSASGPDQHQDVRRLMALLPGDQYESAAAAVDRILTWNRHAVRLMQTRNANDPILGTNPESTLDEPLSLDPLKAANFLLKTASSEVKAVAQHLRLQLQTKSSSASSAAPTNTSNEHKKLKTASTNLTVEGDGVIQQIAALTSKLDLTILNNQAVYARSTQQLRLAAKYLQQVMNLEENSEDGVPSVGTLLNTSAVLVQLEEPTVALEYARSAEKRICQSLATLLGEDGEVVPDELVDGSPEQNDASGVSKQHEIHRCMTMAVTALHNVAIAQSVCPTLSENSVSTTVNKFGSVGDSLVAAQSKRGSVRSTKVPSTSGSTQIATATERNACRRTFQRSQEMADIVLGSQHPLSQAILKSSSRVAATLMKQS